MSLIQSLRVPLEVHYVKSYLLSNTSPFKNVLLLTGIIIRSYRAE